MKLLYGSAFLTMLSLAWLLLQPHNPIGSLAYRVFIGVGTMLLFFFSIVFHYKSKEVFLLLNILGISIIFIIFEYISLFAMDLYPTGSIITMILLMLFLVFYALNTVVKYISN